MLVFCTFAFKEHKGQSPYHMQITGIIKRTYHGVLRFIFKGLWEPSQGWFKSLLIGIIRRLVLATRLFLRERMQFRASALTYSSLLSVVPMLAIIFAVAKGFGLSAFVEQIIRDNVAAKPELVDTLVGFANSYLAHTRGGVFLGIGLACLLWTLINLSSSIETTFNQIWQVKHARSIFRQVTDYTAVLFLLPVFIILSSGISVFAYSMANSLVPDIIVLRPTVLFIVQLVPFGIVCMFFSGLYAFMPNTHVNIRSALVAGIPIGIVFQIIQNLYIHSQIWLSSYNAIYGSFAALPLFMLMCQISWTICLFGATLSYVDQNIHTFYYGKDVIQTSRAEHDFLSIQITAAICKRFTTSQTPYTADELARATKIHLRLVTDILHELCKVGIIMEINSEDKEKSITYIPAHDIHQITTQSVLQTIDTEGDETIASRHATSWKLYYEKRKNMFRNSFPDIPLHKIADEIEQNNK